MPLPVIANVFRVTLLWDTEDGVTPRNVLHFFAPGLSEADLSVTISVANDATADPSHMFHCMRQVRDCNQIEIIKLDGSSPTQVFTQPTPWSGGIGSSQDIMQGAGLVSLHTTQRGPQGRGRVFCGPISESAQSNGILDSTSRGLMDTAWQDFRDALTTAADPATLVVASYEHAAAYTVTTINVPTVIATQRRRLNQLRA